MAERREGEIALPFDPAERAEAGLCFIGRIRSPWVKGTAPKNIGAARDIEHTSSLELDPVYAPALAGLSVGQAVQVLYWVDRGERGLIVQSPAHAEGPRGTFSLRSPVRPNPIALATVVITGLEGATVGIDAIDAYDGTPLLDIKPWIASVDVPPGWRGDG